MKLTDSSIRYIVAGIFLCLAIALIYTHFSGEKQDEKVTEIYYTYQQAFELLQQGQYAQALPLLEQVKAEEPDSVPVTHYLGMSYVNTNELSKASRAYKQVVELNPYKIEDALFMIQFADVLTLNGEKEEALTVLAQCKNLPVPASMPDYQEQVAAKMKELKNNS
ncbi:tetratricopeptide repeat protein [Domibacillus indicus]|uniref:tetratricopeptide repeat protein n=1 Tax=Domibacillus indicus TaxID=1437523 RepID=UPI000B0F5F4A|nr:tetratricopeptide repeat protein [Domibacillus indicus]